MHKIPRYSLISLLASAIFAGLVYLFAWSSIFSVTAVNISGAPTPESTKAITKMVSISPGEKMARVEPRAISSRIKSIDWVQSVDISRHWFSGHLDIKVIPRKPAAYFNGLTIDATGTVFQLPGFAGENLPIVSAAHPKIGLAAIALFKSLPDSFRSQVSSLSAHDTSSFTLQMNIGGKSLEIAWGKNEKTALKIQVINALIALPENKEIKSIDVSAPHAPIVK